MAEQKRTSRKSTAGKDAAKKKAASGSTKAAAKSKQTKPKASSGSRSTGSRSTTKAATKQNAAKSKSTSKTSKGAKASTTGKSKAGGATKPATKSKAPSKDGRAKDGKAKAGQSKSGQGKSGQSKGDKGKGGKAGGSNGELPFAIGDKVVYPHHGAATIIELESLEFGGERQDYYVLEVATDQLTVRVPVTKAVELGVRPVISTSVARKVFTTFRQDPQEAGSNWSRWYKLLTEKINSGDIFQVAEVVRDLTFAQQVKGISPALKRMLAKARLIIVSELRFTLDIEEEEAIKRLERALPKVDEPIEQL